MPRLNAHKAHRLCRSRPDERIGVALHPAGDIASGVLLADADGASAQACHAEAVVGKQVIGQRDGLLVLPLVIALAAQQAVGAGIEDDRAFRPVKTELVVGGGVLFIERHIERRVEADTKAQLLRAGVRYLQSMVHGLALQTEGAGEHKVIGEALCLDGIVRPQFQLDGVSLRPQQSVLQIPGKAVLTALPCFALGGKGAVHQLASPWEQDGCMALPDGGVGLPEHLFACGILQADGLCTVGVHGQGQEFVVNGCLHFQYLLCPSYFPGPAASSILPRVPKIKSLPMLAQIVTGQKASPTGGSLYSEARFPCSACFNRAVPAAG